MNKYRLIFKMGNKSIVYDKLSPKEVCEKLKELLKDNYYLDMNITRNTIYNIVNKDKRPLNPILKNAVEILPLTKIDKKIKKVSN